MLVGGVIVGDQVEIERLACRSIDGRRKFEPLLVAVPASPIADHPAGGDIKGWNSVVLPLRTSRSLVCCSLRGGRNTLRQVDIGGVVAVTAGIIWLTDPWGDLINYFRDLNNTHVEYALVRRRHKPTAAARRR